MPRFYSLPGEIQQMILGFVAESPNTSKYATVNKDWQYFFEKKNFKSLTLEQDDIDDFSKVVTAERQHLVKHVWLQVELPEYSTDPYKEEEDPKVLWEADSVFTKSIFSMWDVLSQWNPDRRDGITFELSAHSLSDWAAYLRDRNTVEDDEREYKRYLTSGSKEPYNPPDPHSPYVQLHEALATPTCGITSVQRDKYWYSTVNNLLGWKPIEFTHEDSLDDTTKIMENDKLQLPEVPVISKFLIRRHQFREIYPTALGIMTESLSNVEGIHIERWRCAESRDEKSWCHEANITFGMDLPLSAKSLTLSGEMNDIFHTWSAKDIKAMSLAKSLRRYTRHLEHLSVSNLIDAKDFFDPFKRPCSEKSTASIPNWENLETLRLTSDLFENGSEKSVECLLNAAARAAREMPRLRSLELWSNNARVFSYSLMDTVADIRWPGSQLNTLSTQVVNEWERTAAFHGREDVRITIS